MYKIGNIGKTEYRFIRRYMKMHFIGIFASHSKFEIIKQNLEKMMKRKDLQLININIKNIENMRNIMFETILIANEINMSNNESLNILSKICNNCKYIIINSDMCKNTKIEANKMINCITYGLNQKSTITISSIQEEKALIYIQRNIKNIEDDEIEMGEIYINLEEYKHMETEDLLAIFSIYLVYSHEKTEK